MEYQNNVDEGIEHMNTFFFFFIIENIYTAIAFHLRNDTHSLCHLTVFILKSVRPLACSFYGVFVM